jgi:hypothetical protein
MIEMKPLDLRVKLIVEKGGNEQDAVTTMKKFCQTYHEEVGNSQLLVQIYEEDFLLKLHLEKSFTFIDSTSGKGGELIGHYQLKEMITVSSRENFPPLVKLENLSFNLTSEEKNNLSHLEFKNYENLSSNFKNSSWGMVALTSEDGSRESFRKSADDKSSQVLVPEPAFIPTNVHHLFPSVQKFIEQNSWVAERIRISRIHEGGRVLRHTDPVNKTDKMIAVRRIHCVIKTNAQSFVSVVDLRGNVHRVQMKEGEVWEVCNILPHFVENEGKSCRDHRLSDIKQSL